MKKLIFWTGMIVTIGISGNEEDPIALVATIALIGIAMMLYGLESVVEGHRIKEKEFKL